jgi:hypothetical protein
VDKMSRNSRSDETRLHFTDVFQQEEQDEIDFERKRRRRGCCVRFVMKINN